jgi:glycine betaine/proline transport system substrate-binding protein
MDKSIRSIGPTAGLSLRSLQAVEAYGLAAAGYRVLPGETEDWVRGFREAYAAQRWIVMPLWQPHFLNRTHELRMLRDPLRALGGADDAVIVANRESFGGLPARMRRALQAVAIGLDGVTEMDLAVNLRGISPRQAAAEWMEANRQRVQEWTA